MGMRQSRPMTTRRGTRPSHVRPRPPSGGRPTPVKVRPRAPAPGRLSVHAPVRRSRGIPLVGRLVLGVGVLAVAVLVLYVGAGGLSVLAGALGTAVTSFVQGVTATPVPSELAPTAPEAPTIESPAEPYTNQSEVDLTITVPSRLAGDPDYRVRVYLALADQAPAPIDEKPLAPTARMIIPVTLTKGINDFSVTLVGPGGESESSPLARWVLDTNPPAIRLISPKDGALINRKAVTLEGRTQGRSTLQVRNTKTGESIGGTAATDGTFSLSLPLTSGSNPIKITATDPAGNTKAIELTVRRGSGRLRASLSASFYSVSQKRLPFEIRLIVLVDDPDGKPLQGARVTFTLSVPGVKTVTGDAVTDANGQASYSTRIPKGADRGGGTAGVLVRTTEFGRTTDEMVINITK
jgi:Glucodextranase, domain B